ncbi:MAG: hypothetical protein HWE27_16015 [Gammaproteobacteria bacterium]|nr:hypothetical protein [Gammaproteobacteria bacterium]
MKNILLVFTGFILFSAFQVMASDEIAGEWHGSLKVPNGELPIVIHLSKSGENWSGKLDSPAQGGFDYPMSSVDVEGNKLIFTIKAMSIHYEGELSASNNQISGNFMQGAVFPLTFERPVDKQAQRVKTSEASMVVGTWSGVLNIPGNPLTVVFNISGDNNELSATHESPDQGEGSILVDSVKFEDGELTLKMKTIGAEFKGLVIKEGSVIDGTFMQNGFKLALKLTPGRLKKN